MLGSISKLWQAWYWAAGDVTKPESVAQAVREHPQAGKRGVGLSGDIAAAPGKSSSPRRGCSVSLQGPSGKSARDQSPAKCCGQECPVLPPTSPEPPLQPCLLCAQGFWLLFRAAGRTLGSYQARLTAGAPLRRSLRQHPHDCQSSGDNELLMCLKSDAGCMARS